MSTQIIKKEENLEKEAPTPLPEIKKVISSSKNHYNLKNFTPFTKKWRVKLYILNENGQWDDRGIGYVFCANEIEEKTNLNDGNKNNEQFAKKLIMLKEKTEEIIFNIDNNLEGGSISILMFALPTHFLVEIIKGSLTLSSLKINKKKKFCTLFLKPYLFGNSSLL